VSKKFFSFLLAFIGVFAVVPGLLEIMLSLTGSSFAWGIVTFAGEFVFWRGLILTASGVLFLSAINEGNPVQKRAQAVLASLMIWIVGGMEILSIVLSSVPGEGKRWLTTLEGFIESYQEPVIPSILLLPLTLGLVLLISLNRGNHE
jgi:hypothetical protein